MEAIVNVSGAALTIIWIAVVVAVVAGLWLCFTGAVKHGAALLIAAIVVAIVFLS